MVEWCQGGKVQGKVIGWDLETDPIGRANLAPAPVCVSWAPGPHVALIDDARGMIEGWLDSDELLIGTNLPFDFACLMSKWPDLRAKIFAKLKRGQAQCISINQKLIDLATKGMCEPAYSLETLCGMYGVPSPDKQGPWRLEYDRLRTVPVENWPQGSIDYVLGDATAPLTIAEKQHTYDKGWTERTGAPILHLAGSELYKGLVFYLMSAWGIHTHPERTRAFHDKLRAHLDKSAKRLIRTKLVREDGSRDTKKAKAYMLKLNPHPKLTDKGGICMDKEACADTGSRVLQLYSDYSQSTTLMARADDMMQGFELPLQTRYNPLLETGRSSSSKPKPPVVGMQAQNFPRKAGARECLTPRPGHGFLSGDLPTAELRSLGQVCIDRFGWSKMADAINSGRDIHTWFAAAILGVTYEELLKRIADEDPIATEARQQAKPYNFGLPGGQGVDSFVLFAWRNYRLRITTQQAAKYKALWLDTFPEMALYFKWVSKMCDNKRKKALVRHLRSGRWRANVPYCATCNTQFQELTACAATAGLCEVSRLCYSDPDSWLWNSRPLMFTHDENVLEVPLERGHEAAMEFADVMRDEFNVWHPDVPIAKVDVCLSMTYSKKMKPIWRDGRLVAA